MDNKGQRSGLSPTASMGSSDVKHLEDGLLTCLMSGAFGSSYRHLLAHGGKEMPLLMQVPGWLLRPRCFQLFHATRW